MKSILLIDDDPQLLKVLQRLLRPHRADWEFMAAADGQEAIALIQQRSFDLIVTDILMPGRDGLGTIGAVRGMLPFAKILAMTGGGGFEGKEFLNIATVLGAHATLEKPFDPEVFLSTVRRLLDTPILDATDCVAPLPSTQEDPATAPNRRRL